MLFLCFDVDYDPGLEFHGEAVIVNGDLLDQLSAEAVVEFGDFGLLTSDEVLQLVEPCLDTVRAHRVGGYYSFCNVLLHLPDEAVLVVEYLVERLGCDFMQEFLFTSQSLLLLDGLLGLLAIHFQRSIPNIPVIGVFHECITE